MKIRVFMVRFTYPFGTVVDIADGIPDPGEHPKLKSSGREDGLLETPDQRPTMREMSEIMENSIEGGGPTM